MSADDAATAAGKQVFRLYVSTASPVSARAIVNTRRFFDRHLPGDAVDLTILPLTENVEAARRDQVFASPTLIRVSPLPLRRFIGDLSDADRLRVSLGLPALAEERG